MKFRTYLLISIVTAVTVPFIFFIALEYQATIKQLQKNKLEQSQYSSRVSDEIRNWVDTAQRFINLAAAEASTYEAKDTKKLSEVLQQIHFVYPQFLNIHFDNSEGKTITFFPNVTVGEDHTGRAHWEAIQKGKFEVSDIIRGKGASTELLVNVMATSSFKDGQPFYAVAALNLKKLAELIKRRYANSGYNIWVADRKGALIFASDIGASESSVIPVNILKKAFKSKTAIWTSFNVKREGSLEGTLEKVPDVDWVVAVLQSKCKADSQKRSVVLWNIFLSLLVLTLSVVASHFVSKPLSRAVNILNQQVKAKHIKLTQKEKIYSPDELRQLQQTFVAVFKELVGTQNKLVRLNADLENEVKRQISKVQRQAALLQSIFMSMSDGLIILDNQYRVVSFNQKSKDLFGELSLGSNLLDLLREKHPKDFFGYKWQKNEAIRIFDTTTKKCLDFIGFQIQEVPAPMFGFLLHDVTMEQEISRMKDELIGMAAHELKTPLSAIKLQADFLSRLPQEALTKQTVKEISSELISEVDRLKNLVEAWLNVAKIDSGAYVVTPQVVQIKPLIQRALKTAVPTLNIDLRIEVAENAECLRLDPDAFLQVFINLFNNSMRYAKPHTKPKVEISVQRDPKFVRIFFKDNGIGIAKENLNKIFDRFYQVDMSSRRKQGGTGLGLVIVKGIVKLHGGSICVQSTLNKGTQFIISLPSG